MSKAVEYLVRRRTTLKTDIADTLEEIARLESQIAGHRKRIDETSATVTELDDAIIRLGGKIEPPVVIKTLARTKVEGY